jgi:hypothetical protein
MLRIKQMCLLAGTLALTTVTLPVMSAQDTKKLEASIAVQNDTEKAAAASQKKIDKIADETERMLTEYKLTLRQYDALNGYNDQVQKIVNAQQEELDSLEQQLLEIDTTNQGVIPLMIRMVENLEKFIALDIPFLPDERAKRLDEVKLLLDRADITVSEKYRRIMEAYQVETEYGRTIEAYNGELNKDGTRRSVSYLRIGRVALLYQTLDRKETAVWDHAAKRWEVLSEEYRNPVLEGLRIAQKQAPPNLIKLPITAPEKVQ